MSVGIRSISHLLSTFIKCFSQISICEIFIHSNIPQIPRLSTPSRKNIWLCLKEFMKAQLLVGKEAAVWRLTGNLCYSNVTHS